MSKDESKVKKVEPPKVTFVQQVIKGDTYLVMADSTTLPEDEYSGLYWTSAKSSNLAIEPPYVPAVLKHLVSHNNILNQCVQAMEVNVDGTGHDFVSKEAGKDPDEKELKRAKSFFNEPYPNKSFVQIRRRARRDMESVGYSYFEILRNLGGEMVSLRNVETNNIRLVKLDDPVEVEKEIERDGSIVKIKMMERERRFIQKIGNYEQFFREFGSTRHLHKKTGEWESENNKVSPQDRATELLAVIVDPDISTSYGIPRWINQLPSVLGSRKAEEANLEFFDAGGMPPAIIFIQGGVLAKDAADQLRMYLSGMNKQKNRAVVVEAHSSSGSLDSAGTVQVKVERFGAERANDAMYANYDEKAEEHVRVGFRLPPMFVGRAQDYNFATAVTSYMVAEAQVFQPEREEFDELINKTLMKELGLKNILFKSKPITLKDIANQLKAMEISKDVVEGEDFVSAINAITGLDLKYKEPEPPQPPAMQPASVGPDGKPLPLVDHQTGSMVKPFGEKPEKPDLKLVAGKKSAKEILDLAEKYAAIEGLHPVMKREDVPESEHQSVMDAVSSLEGDDLDSYFQIFSRTVFGNTSNDLVTLTHHH